MGHIHGSVLYCGSERHTDLQHMRSGRVLQIATQQWLMGNMTEDVDVRYVRYEGVSFEAQIIQSIGMVTSHTSDRFHSYVCVSVTPGWAEWCYAHISVMLHNLRITFQRWQIGGWLSNLTKSRNLLLLSLLLHLCKHILPFRHFFYHPIEVLDWVGFFTIDAFQQLIFSGPRPLFSPITSPASTCRFWWRLKLRKSLLLSIQTKLASF